MALRPYMEGLYQKHTDDLVGCAEFVALESGQVSRAGYDRFLENVIRTHLKSPQLLAFLFALAPPRAAERLRHNMLEELGLDQESGASHPSLLRVLATEAGLGSVLTQLEAGAAQDLKKMVEEPLLFGTLKEVGFSALVEICAFEFMLSRVAGRMARALAAHRGLSARAIEWFTHHSEVDVGHAEQGFENLDAYADYYSLAEEDARTLAGMALRDNVFIKRYFGELPLARARSLL